MARYWGLLCVLLMCLAVLAFLKRNQLPDSNILQQDLLQEPVQKVITRSEFTASFKGVDYRVKPLFEYELNGLVVSLQHHSGDSLLHKAWNDHLNVMDLCVLWAGNAQLPALDRFKFWNGQFTCNVQTRDTQAWSQFNLSELSNNHLLSADSFTRKQLSKIKIGDQVKIKGVLAEYGSIGGGRRGTSTRRDDTGNGACETIYVEDVQVLSHMSNIWRKLWLPSLALAVVCFFFYLCSPYQPHRH